MDDKTTLAVYAIGSRQSYWSPLVYEYDTLFGKSLFKHVFDTTEAACLAADRIHCLDKGTMAAYLRATFPQYEELEVSYIVEWDHTGEWVRETLATEIIYMRED